LRHARARTGEAGKTTTTQATVISGQARATENNSTGGENGDEADIGSREMVADER